MAQSVLTDLVPRLRKAGQEAREAKQAYSLRTKALKKLVVQAADEGMAYAVIAEAAGFASKGRVTQILAEDHDDD